MTFSEAMRLFRKPMGGGRLRIARSEYQAMFSVQFAAPFADRPVRERFLSHRVSERPRTKMGGRWGHNVGGNDPGFGRAMPPKTLRARFACCGGRSRPRGEKSSGQVTGQRSNR